MRENPSNSRVFAIISIRRLHACKASSLQREDEGKKVKWQKHSPKGMHMTKAKYNIANKTRAGNLFTRKWKLLSSIENDPNSFLLSTTKLQRELLSNQMSEM